MAKPILLTCNVPAKRAAKLRAAAVRMGIRVHAVEKWEYLNPVGSFTGDCGSFESMYDGEGFRDELLVLLVNTDPEEAYEVQRGDRVAQLVVQRVEQAAFAVVDELPRSARGRGGFGHTGR